MRALFVYKLYTSDIAMIDDSHSLVLDTLPSHSTPKNIIIVVVDNIIAKIIAIFQAQVW